MMQKDKFGGIRDSNYIFCLSLRKDLYSFEEIHDVKIINGRTKKDI
jgi:hypothetical protein